MEGRRDPHGWVRRSVRELVTFLGEEDVQYLAGRPLEGREQAGLISPGRKMPWSEST